VKRREFITLLSGAVSAWPLEARAQQLAMPVIGFLSGRSLAYDSRLVAAFHQGLKEVGFVEGQNVAIEFRWAEGQFDRLAALAADLVGRQVSVIFAGGLDVRIRDVKAAISATPVVFATAGDPVELGLVASFSRPGGNATAVTVISASLWPKRLNLLHELLASSIVIALLVNPDDPSAEPSTKDVYAAAKSLGLQVHVLRASTEKDFEAAFAMLVSQQASALLVTNNALFNSRREELVALAARHAVPTIYDRRDFPADGGLMSYGASIVEQYRQSGLYVGRILSGTKPADLPVVQPTKLELVINLKTAKALGLTFPQTLLVAADEVIE
jgi:putative tryptophan/tyrosine transport system substrate-binding protein